MTGITWSSTNCLMLSRIARSSSESAKSMLKMSLAVIPKDSRAGRAKLTTRPGNDSDRARLAPEIATVIDGEAALVLPLVHHLVQQRVHSLVPTVATDVPPADHDLGTAALLAAKYVVAEPALHSPRHPDRNRCELAGEPRFVEPCVMVLENTHERLIGRMSRLCRAGLFGSRIPLSRARRVEIERKLNGQTPASDQASERSKQRCGPGTNVVLARDQM